MTEPSTRRGFHWGAVRFLSAFAVTSILLGIVGLSCNQECAKACEPLFGFFVWGKCYCTDRARVLEEEPKKDEGE